MLSSLLEHVRVLSAGHTLPAMYCIPVLRDLGADVTLVDAPAAESGTARYAVAALWRRVQAGAGCYLDIAIVDGPAFLMAMEYDYFWTTGRPRQRGDTPLCGGYPWYHVFETADGRYLSVAAVEPQFYARLCTVMGRPDLA